jgi:hypothetical protein
MFADHMVAAIDAARTLTRLDDLSKSIWQGLTAGAVGDDDAQRLAELLHVRRKVVRGDIVPVGIPPGRPSIFPPKRPQRAPVRAVAIARRRHLAASGPMPPTLACKFTVGELAVLKVVADEVRDHGRCDRTLGEIAARAGVCHRLARNAVRQAERLGLLTIEERRRQGQKNLPNVVRVVSREWLTWLTRGDRGKKSAAHGQEDRRKGAPTARRAAAEEGWARRSREPPPAGGFQFRRSTAKGSAPCS